MRKFGVYFTGKVVFLFYFGLFFFGRGGFFWGIFPQQWLKLLKVLLMHECL